MKTVVALLFCLCISTSVLAQVENMKEEYRVIVEYNNAQIYFDIANNVATFNGDKHIIASDYFSLYYFVRKNGDIVAFPVGSLSYDRMRHRCNMESRIMVHVAEQSLPDTPNQIHAIWILRKSQP